MLARLATLVVLLFVAQPGTAQPTVPMTWAPIDSLQARLPEGVAVYAGHNDVLPLRAWYVRLAPDVRLDVVASDDPDDARETASSFARDLGACVVLNGGYFAMQEVPSRAVGLLVVDGEVRAPATAAVSRDGQLFATRRAAFGLDPDGTPTFTWATTTDDAVWAWTAPLPHRPDRRVIADTATRRLWTAEDALSAGPMLLRDGALHVTSDEEVFFGTSIPETHPRTAIGRAADGSLLLLVVDGRQPESRGVDLDELAVLMRDLGAVDALNLDGGGSSTLVVGGVRLNRPAGGNVEREIHTALVATCH